MTIRRKQHKVWLYATWDIAFLEALRENRKVVLLKYYYEETKPYTQDWMTRYERSIP